LHSPFFSHPSGGFAMTFQASATLRILPLIALAIAALSAQA
jgi:hypothetical protein